MKPKFKLPETKLCVVMWYRHGIKNETLIDTPATSGSLIDTMLMKHHVGFSEIHGVKSVEAAGLVRIKF